MRHRTSLPLTLIALFFSSAITVQTVHAECRSFKVTSATMLATKLDKAKQRARGAWELKVNRLDGLATNAWNDWANAHERSYSCHKKAGTYRCKATARPCTREGGAPPPMVCDGRPTTGGTGKASSIERAKKEARHQWEKTARANWGEARNQKYDCRKKGKHRWYCNGIARRCFEKP